MELGHSPPRNGGQTIFHLSFDGTKDALRFQAERVMIQGLLPGSRKRIRRSRPLVGNDVLEAPRARPRRHTRRAPAPRDPPGCPRARPTCSGLSVPSVKWVERQHPRPPATGGEAQARERGARVGAHKLGDTAAAPVHAPCAPRPPGRPPARRPYHTTRKDSSKNPGKTRSSLAMAQRRPKSTIPGMAEALLPDLGPARLAPVATRSPAPSGTNAKLTATRRRRARSPGPARRTRTEVSQSGRGKGTLRACADTLTGRTLGSFIAVLAWE